MEQPCPVVELEGASRHVFRLTRQRDPLGALMAHLIVRDLEEDLVHALKRRAAERDGSAEAEHREILRQVLRSRRAARAIKDLLPAIPDVGTDADVRHGQGPSGETVSYLVDANVVAVPEHRRSPGGQP